MKNKNQKLLTGALVMGALLGFSAPSANASTLFTFDNLGSGAAVRTALSDNATNSDATTLEMKCGNKGKSGDMKGDKMDGKSKDGKCGEGKCGSKKHKKIKHNKSKDGNCANKGNK